MIDPISTTRHLDEISPVVKNISKPGLLFLINLLLPLALSFVFKNIWFFMLFGIPSLISSFFVKNKKVSFSKADFVNFISNIIEGGFYAIGIIFHFEFYALALGLSFGFGVRVFFLRAFGLSLGNALVKASIRLFIIMAIFFLFYSHPSDTNLGRKVLAMSFLFLVLVMFIIYSISKPFRIFTKIDPYALAVAFFTDWFKGSTKTEEHLLKLSKDGKAIVHLLSFETYNSQKKGQPKATFLIPYIHPGPMGNIGSSNMPKIFHDNIKNSLTFHGPCTHDLNLVRHTDVMKLVGDIKSAPTEQLGKKAKAVFGDHMCLLDIGGKTLAFADGDGDIDIGVGIASSDIFVDMHSSGVDSVLDNIHAGSLQGLEFIDEARLLKTKLAKEKPENMAIGTSFGVIGGCEVRVAYLDVGKKIVFILFDSNNLKGRLLLRKLQIGYKIIACTTDSHNRNNGKYIFEVLPEHLSEISQLIKKAKANAEPVIARYNKIERITKLFGDAYELLPNTGVILGFLKIALPFVITLALIFVVLAVMLWST